MSTAPWATHLRTLRDKQHEVRCQHSAEVMNVGVRPAPKSRTEVIAAIKGKLDEVKEQMARKNKVVLRFWEGRSWEDVQFSPESGILESATAVATAHADKPRELTRIEFPSSRGSRRFAILMSLMVTCLRLLEENAMKTLRDVYYLDVRFYQSQDAVNRAATDLASLLEIPRISLNIMASSKGWVSGDLRFRRLGALVDCRSSIVTVPVLLGELSHPQSAAEFVLVVEKDAVFQQLVAEGFANDFPCLIITGRGYPDVSTRAFLKWLIDQLCLPSFALVDADPHGMEIMSVYCVGSRAMAGDAHNLAVPTLKWLGVLPSDLVRYNVAPQALIPFTPKDSMKARDMLTREYVFGNARWLEELQLMVRSGHKAEVESLQGPQHGLRFLTQHFLPDKLFRGGWCP